MKNTTTDSLGFLLHDSARLLRRRFEARGGEHGLSAAQWRLLVHLARQGAAPQARLAQLLEVEPISVSRLLDRMEQGGWVKRRPDPNDRRVRMVHPTDKTLEAFASIKAVAGEVYDEALAGLTVEEREILMRGLKAIVANLGEGDGAAACGQDSAKGMEQ
ncbi:MAG: MarR family transcriptional regulator [Paracoccaceae bacterium]